mmetsp:Transcript_124561/g.248512  ORF Transcript_124561/g.248512 Transcript_124561/m.248512 type:complete len:291 (+) Transcript_124561:49-921(+)
MSMSIRLLCLLVLLVPGVFCQGDSILLQLHTKTGTSQQPDSPRNDSKRPCNCAAFDSAWRKPFRALPKCIFVDLGAADGNSFTPFLQDQFGPVANCGTAENPGDYEAFLVEANPHFDVALQQLSATGSGRVHAVNSTAAYMCDASTTFFLDASVEHNHWASSMDGASHKWPGEASDTSNAVSMEGGEQTGLVAMDRRKITVPTMNLLRLLYEQTIPDDWVIVKMDIEGAEWDILPCLATSPVVTLVDQLYVEEHPIHWQLGNTTREEMDLAKQRLAEKGVQVPTYYSPTL